MSSGFSAAMKNLDEPEMGQVADVAHALLRAASRLFSTRALLLDAVCQSFAWTGRREESRRGTQECVRYVGGHCPTLAHQGSMTSGVLSLDTARKSFAIAFRIAMVM